MPRATGASRRHSGLSAAAAARKSAAARATKPQAKPRERIPAGNWRILVRGLRPSMDASTSRLNAIAAERAPIISSVRRRRFQSMSVDSPPFYRQAPSCYSGVRGGLVHMLEAFSLSDMGCVRTNNEDYCFIDAERGLYVLADAIGGAKAGEHASRIAVETVAE